MLVALITPLRTVYQQPTAALLWIAATVVLGTFSIWIVPLTAPDRADAFVKAVLAGNLASYCVVLLADTIAWDRIVGGQPQESGAAGARALGISAAVVLILIQISFYHRLAEQAPAKPEMLNLILRRHYWFAVWSIIVAFYLVCFRLREQVGVPGADDFKQDEDQEVATTAHEARLATKTSDGIDL
jgi:amino acid transporter